ncbi:MAG: MBL fold metallo-hydrolase [Wenzhouxiangellaceae bacterium]|nr:MBL fold metallo-hydrolase [Wenzhouxiangellaceae bacterium]
MSAQSQKPRLRFLGATDSVTGSKFLLEAQGRKILVDCGLYQGYKQLRERNWRAFPIAPVEIDCVVLTHAHLDHSGYLPLLARNGFAGPVYASAATHDLCRYLLPDSGFIHEKDAEFANRHGFSKHKPARPLYTRADAVRCLALFRNVEFHDEHALGDGISMRLARAGHILGAASIRFRLGDTSILFSGDLGHSASPIMAPPEPAAEAETVVVESTYGDRRRDRSDPQDALAAIITDTAARGGTVIVPAFSVGRSQALLFHLHQLIDTGRIPRLPVFLDSPLAIGATDVFRDHPDDHRLTEAQAEAACSLPRLVADAEQSKALDLDPVPKIIIAGSGMATGGRVLHHLKVYAPRPENAIVFTGYQAGGTRGAKLVAGAEQVKIHGRYWPVRARVHNLEMMSAHADGGEILDWLATMPGRPAQVFVVHGEAQASDTLRQRIEEALGWSACVPELGQVYELGE